MTLVRIIQDDQFHDSPLWRVYWHENGEDHVLPFSIADLALEFANGKAKRLGGILPVVAGGNGAAVGVFE